MHTEQNMKRKLRVLALILAPALIFAACTSPTSDTKAPEEVIYSVGVNGVMITTSDLIQGVREALTQSIQNGSTKDGKLPANAMDVSFGGGDLRLADESSMYKLFMAIDEYYVNLDLSGIPGSQFSYLPKLEPINRSGVLSLTLSDRVNTIKGGSGTGDNAFNDFTDLKSIRAPGVTIVGNYAFVNSTALTNVDMPNAEYIRAAAFSGCLALSTLSLPKANTIGQVAFYDCISLTTLDIPEAKNISNRAFEASPALAKAGTPNLTITLGATPPTLGVTLFNAVGSQKAVTVKRPSSAATDYAANSNAWSDGLKGKGWTSADGAGDGTASAQITVSFQDSDTVSIE